jgi:peptidyl-tRNA hydrolase, PTH1 family
LKLIVGLGNPGRQYSATRHNVGFRLIDELAKRHRIHVKRRMGRALVGEGRIGDEDVLLVKPLTFMNLSGESVSHLARRYRVQPEDVIVAYDDMNLPTGKLRVRARGSSGGHNGMKSLIYCLRTEEFPRVRVGIGSVEGQAIEHGLSKFTRAELELISPAISTGADAVEAILADGIEPAMNRFN